MNESLDFSPYLERWALQPDGEPFATHSSRLLPVRHRGAAAMLKISSAEEERFGHVLLNWWDGQGAARVLAYDHQALLMERATGGRSLLEMVKRGDDDEATRILCQAIERIHAPRPGPLPELTPLERWFDSLYAAERRYGGLYVDCANAARYLLETAREQRPLHGDIHHGNVLDFGERGWQVIDPKRLYGERGYDYANLFTNPDAKTAQAPGRFERQLEIVVAASGLQRRRLLLWILAWTGLSAAWFDEDGSREETERHPHPRYPGGPPRHRTGRAERRRHRHAGPVAGGDHPDPAELPVRHRRRRGGAGGGAAGQAPAAEEEKDWLSLPSPAAPSRRADSRPGAHPTKRLCALPRKSPSVSIQ